MKCKYAQREKDYVYCMRDGSFRKEGCPCRHFTLTAWGKFKVWLSKRFGMR